MDMTMDFLTVSQIAELEGVSVRYIVAEIERGKFPNARKLDPEKQTSAYLIPAKDYAAWKKRRAQSSDEDD